MEKHFFLLKKTKWRAEQHTVRVPLAHRRHCPRVLLPLCLKNNLAERREGVDDPLEGGGGLVSEYHHSEGC